MAEFDLSIIATLNDMVSGPARAMASALNDVSSQARAMGNSFIDRVGPPVLSWLKMVDRNGDAIINATQRMGAGWDMMKRGAGDMYNRITGIFTGLWTTIRRFSVLTGLTLGGIGYMFSSWARGIHDQEEFAKTLGVSSQALKEWNFAAKQANVPISTMSTSLEYFAKQLGMAREKQGSFYNYFKDVDPAFMDRVLRQKDTLASFAVFMDELYKKYPEAGIAGAAEAFGRGAGPEMYRLALSDWRRAMALQRQLNPPLTEKQKKDLEEYMFTVNNLGEAWQGLKTAMMMPVVIPLTDALKELQAWMTKKENKDWLKQGVKEGIGYIKEFMGYLRETDWKAKGKEFNDYVIAPIKSVKDAFGGWTNLAKAMLAIYIAGPALTILTGFCKTLAAGGGLMAMLGLTTTAAGGVMAILAVLGLVAGILALWYRFKTGHKPTPIWDLFKGEEAKEAQKQLEDMSKELDKLFDQGGPGPDWKKFIPPDAVKRGFQASPSTVPYWTPRNLYPPKDQSRLTPELEIPPLPTRKPIAKGESWWDWIKKQFDWSASGAEAPAMGGRPIVPRGGGPQSLPTPPRLQGPAQRISAPSVMGGANTQYATALKRALDNLNNQKPAEAAANAPVAGIPPTGITIQARGPSVHITQAPPNVNIAVTVNVLRPDEAPIATAMGVVGALERQMKGAPLFDGGTET